MPHPALLIPVLFVQAPSAPPVLDQVQAHLGAISQAVVDGRPGETKALMDKARTAWSQARPALKGVVPDAEAGFVDRQLKSMQAMSPRERAMGALMISRSLAEHQPAGRARDLAEADRAAKVAWCNIDAGYWNQVPPVGELFRAILRREQGRRPLVEAAAEEALKRLEPALKKQQAGPAKKALKDLLAQVEALQKG